MTQFLIVAGLIAGSLLLFAGLLHLMPRLGRVGAGMSEAMCRAPWLDVVVTVFTVLPLVVGPILDGWRGLGAGLAGMLGAYFPWVTLHELAHPQARRGPRIVKVVNRLVGRWRNHLAVWDTAIVVPIFWLVRIAQVVVYPPLVWLLRFPRYRHSDWIRVSRHKFNNLVGHDLIWCLYCDWMTGVWSLGSEMLRNVESFWCPIRFDSSKKCANCAVDFPDVIKDWVPAEGTMAEVTTLVEAKYQGSGTRAWFGHPARLTVERGEVPERQEATPSAP